METIEPVGPPDTVSRKRDLLRVVIFFNLVATAATWISTGEGPVFTGVAVFQTVGNSVATLVWFHLDAAERGVVLGMGFRVIVVLFGPLTLFYYLPVTRGIKGGLIGLAWAFGFFVVLILSTSLLNVLLALVSDRMGLFAAGAQ